MHRQILLGCSIFLIAFYAQASSPTAEASGELSKLSGKSVIKKDLVAERIEELTYESAIAKALRFNIDILKLRIDQERRQMDYDRAWDTMYMPNVNFNLSAGTSMYTLAQLPHTSVTSDTVPNPTAVRGRRVYGDQGDSSASVSLGSYTLYNFGKDRDNFQLSKMSYERFQQEVKERERNVRFDVFTKLFEFKNKEDLLDISKQSVENSQIAYDLIKSRVQVGKAQASDLSSAEVDLLNAKNQVSRDETDYNAVLLELNRVLGDRSGTKYTVKSKISFKKFTTELDKIIAVAKENSPEIRSAKVTLESARLRYKIAQKNRLPLPRIAFTGVTVGYSYGQYTTGTTRTTDASSPSTSGNFDLTVGVSLSLPLMGGDGFLNARSIRMAELDEESAEIDLLMSSNTLEDDIRTLFVQIKQQESQIENAEKLFMQANEVFENALKQLQSASGSNRLELKDAIKQRREAEVSLTNTILDHYKAKLSLARRIGVDSFPEDRQ